MEYHRIDSWPIPNDAKAIYINEPYLADKPLQDWN